MQKTMRKMTAIIVAAAMIMTASVFSFAETAGATGRLADGTYTVGVKPDVNGAGKMFYIAYDDKNTCKLTVKDGVMTATVRLNGSGYDKLYLGTAEEAAKADESAWIKYVEDAEEYYTFQVPVSAFDQEMPVAAYGSKGKAWHDHTLTFSYNTPAKTTLKSLKAGKKSIKVSWKKQTSNVTGYQLQYSTRSTFKSSSTVKITKNTATTKTISKLKSGKRYYVRVRTFKKVGSKYYYSGWSGKKSVKVK